MPIHNEVELRDGYLIIESIGSQNTAVKIDEYGELIRQEGNKHNQKRILLDQRRMDGEGDFHDAYEACESAIIAKLILTGFRLACVSKPDNLKENQAWELLLNNRSLNFKVFLDFDEAVDWLTMP